MTLATARVQASGGRGLAGCVARSRRTMKGPNHERMAAQHGSRAFSKVRISVCVDC